MAVTNATTSNLAVYNAQLSSLPSQDAATAVTAANTQLGVAQDAEVKVSDALDAVSAAPADAAAQANLSTAVSDAQTEMQKAIEAQKVANDLAIKSGQVAPFQAAQGIQSDYQVSALPVETVQTLLGVNTAPGTAPAGTPTVSAAALQNLDPAKLNNVLSTVFNGSVSIDPTLPAGSPGGPARSDNFLQANVSKLPESSFNQAERERIEGMFRNNPTAVATNLQQYGAVDPSSMMAYMAGVGGTPATGQSANSLLSYDSVKGDYVANTGIDVSGKRDIWRNTTGDVSMAYFGDPPAFDQSKGLDGDVYMQTGKDASGNATYNFKFQGANGKMTDGLPASVTDAQKAQIISVLSTQAAAGTTVGNRTIDAGGDLGHPFGVPATTSGGTTPPPGTIGGGTTLPPGTTGGTTPPPGTTTSGNTTAASHWVGGPVPTVWSGGADDAISNSMQAAAATAGTFTADVNTTGGISITLQNGQSKSWTSPQDAYNFLIQNGRGTNAPTQGDTFNSLSATDQAFYVALNNAREQDPNFPTQIVANSNRIWTNPDGITQTLTAPGVTSNANPLNSDLTSSTKEAQSLLALIQKTYPNARLADDTSAEGGGVPLNGVNGARNWDILLPDIPDPSNPQATSAISVRDALNQVSQSPTGSVSLSTLLGYGTGPLGNITLNDWNAAASALNGKTVT